MPEATQGQAFTVEWTVPGSLDGTTQSPVLRAPSENADPQGIYRPEVEGDLGLIDVDYFAVSTETRRGAIGNRYVAFFTLEASVAGGVGAALEVVDATVDPPVVQEVVEILVGVTEIFIEKILVPQGSVLRISGFPVGPTPHRIRATIQYLTTKSLIEVQKGIIPPAPAPIVPTWAQVLAAGNLSGGLGNNPTLERDDRLYINGTPIWGAYTLAELSAFGSADGLDIDEGAWAFDTTNKRWVSLTYLQLNSSTWFQPGLAYRDYVENLNHWTQWQTTAGDYVIVLADGGNALTSGAAATALADAAHPGVLLISITATLNSRAGARETGGVAGGGIRLGVLPFTSETLAQHSVKPSVTDRFEIYLCLVSDVGSIGQPTNGCYFVLDQTSGNWIARTRIASGVPTNVNTGVDGTVNTWRRFKVIATTAQALFYIDDVLVATIVTTIPTGQLYGCSGWMWRTNAEGGAVNLGLDYNYWRQDLR